MKGKRKYKGDCRLQRLSTTSRPCFSSSIYQIFSSELISQSAFELTRILSFLSSTGQLIPALKPSSSPGIFQVETKVAVGRGNLDTTGIIKQRNLSVLEGNINKRVRLKNLESFFAKQLENKRSLK